MKKGISIQRPSVERPSTIIIASRRDSATPVQVRQKASKFRVFLSRIISWLTADPLIRIRTLNPSTRIVQGEHHTIDLRDSRLPNVVPSRTSFDPRALRKPSSPIKPWMAFTNLVRTVFGVGFLALPLAFSQVGYVLGITFMIFTGILLIHGHLCLLWCLNEVSKQLRVPYVNYRYGFRLTLLHGPECFANLGEYGPAVVAIILILSQIGICSVFVGFTADCLKDMADLDSTGTALLYLLLPYLLMSLLMKDLRIISYISALGNISDLLALGLMLVQIFSDPHGKMVPIIARPLPMLVAFGTMLFNMSSTGVILMIDRSLSDPTVLLGKYGFISLITVIATVAGTVFSILSYWSFGTIDGNVLRSLPFDFSLSIWTISLFFVSITFTYPLQSYPGLYVIMQLIRDRNVDVKATDEFMKILEIVTRPCFVLF